MKDCWIKPNGQIIEVGDMQHNSYASDLLEKEMGLEGMMDYLEKNNCDSPYEILHKRGWVKVRVNSYGSIEIVGNCISLIKPMRNTCDPAMNFAQMKTAKRLCRETNTEFHKAINERRFW